MKKTFNILTLGVALSILMNSCATNKQAVAIRTAEIKNSKETVGSVFVKLSNGDIRYYKTLKLVTGPFTAPHLLADKKTVINPADIIAYQNEDHYAISQKMFVNGRRSYLAKETLPGFAVRIAKGKLNIYCKKFYNGTVAVDEFFLQAGNEGQIFSFTPELMKSLIKDNYEAMAVFNTENEKESMSKKLEKTAEVYNNALLMSKN